MAVFTLVFCPQSIRAQQAFQTQLTSIICQDPADLLEMKRRLRFRQPENFHPPNVPTPDPVHAALPPQLAAKVDGLLARVYHLLNSRPQGPGHLRIVLLKNAKEVRQRYLALQPASASLRVALFKDGKEVEQRYLAFQPLSAPPVPEYRPLEAFYEPRTRTIFLSLMDLDDGILAHEMAHFVLCESSPTPLPPEAQEDWAHYVEARIK